MDKFIVSTNPSNYEVLGKVKISTEEEIKAKVKKANNAKEAWKDLRVEGRISLLRKLVDKIAEKKEELAVLETKEMGMPITQSRMDVDSAIDYFNWYLDNALKYLCPETSFEDEKTIHKVYFEPIGVAAVIIPWNFPISNFVWGVAQNLVAGNTVILKHSEECPLFGKLLEEIVDSCKLPDGVFNEIYGNGKIGDYLAHQDIDLIWFTGSTKIGKYLYQVGSEKFIKVLLELGGSAPGIVFQDANIDALLETIYFAKFLNAGQVCDGLKRLIVHESKFDDVVDKFKKLIESKKVGNPQDETTGLGPLVAKRQLDLLEAQLLDAIEKGAKIISGGKKPKNLKGAFFEPTILTNINSKMRVWTEEVFGPVLPIVSFKTDTDAIRLANDTKYGLGSYIFTEDKNKALEVASKIDAGMVSINNAYYLNPNSPFGGYKESGLGREHGKYGLRELCQIKIIASEK